MNYNKLRNLYELLKEVKSDDNRDDYQYLKWIVQHTERDFMSLLLKQLDRMDEDNKLD